MPVYGSSYQYTPGSFNSSLTGTYGANPDIFQGATLQNAYDQSLRKSGLSDAQIGIQPAMTGEANKMTRFNAILPLLSGFGSGNFQRVGGQSGPSPTITVGGVWNPQQIQQQVNATRAQNDQGMQTQNREAASNLGGRGFGSNSPLLQAIYGQNQAANLGANTQAEQQLRTTAAQQNATQTLNTQQARESQFASRMQEDIERRKSAANVYTAMISALGGLV